MDRLTDRLITDRRTDGQTDGRADRMMRGQAVRKTDGWTRRRTDGRTRGRTDRAMDGQADRRTDGQTDGWTERDRHRTVNAEKILKPFFFFIKSILSFTSRRGSFLFFFHVQQRLSLFTSLHAVSLLKTSR